MKSQDKVLLIRKKLFRAYEGRAEILKALAHPARLIMIETMQESGEICVNDLVEMIGCDQSTVSKHLAILKQAGLVEDRKEGQRSFYRMARPPVADLMDCVERIMAENLEARHGAMSV